MSWSNSFYKRMNRFCLGRLKKLVASGRMRPFSVDQDGVWYKTGYDFWVYSDLKTKILKLDSCPVWEKEASRLIFDSIRDKVFVDIGANHGYFSLLAAKAGAKAVYAFEPISYTFENPPKEYCAKSLCALYSTVSMCNRKPKWNVFHHNEPWPQEPR
ncbi:MAG TPA: hypothetical protein P5033_12440 [Anaerohalosphaeraceae bacterium]|nr:hypothetical protein [Anaerohalosphaeraceae bacterium]